MSIGFDFDKDNIKNLVFDVGSVLIGYRWRDMFKDHGTDPEIALAVGRGIFDHPNWKLFDSGIISGKELIDSYCDAHPEYAEDARWFIENAIQMRVIRPRVYEELIRLKDKGYKLYILSNYSQELYELHTADLPFRELMDGELVSYMVHALKPDKEIYNILLERFDLVPEESLFFDDRLENVEGAKKLSINALHVKDESEELLLSYLKEL